MKEKLWTRTFVVNMFLNLIFYLVFYLPTVVIGSFAAQEYQASTLVSGMLTGLFILGAFSSRMWAGTSLGKLGAKKMLYIGAVIYLFFGLLYYLVGNIELLVILRFLHGIGFGIATTAAGTIAGHIVPISRRGEGIGYFALSVTLSSAIGPFLSMALYHAYGFSILLHLSNVLSLLALIGIFFIKEPDMKTYKSEDNEKKKLSWSNFFEKDALSISFMAFLIGIAYSSILAFMNAYASSIDLVTAGSVFFLVYALTILLTRPVTGRIFDLKGDNFVMYPTYLFFAIGLLLVGLAHSGLSLLVAAVFVGLGYGSFSPFGQAIAIRSVKTDRLGIATSTFFGFLDMGVGFGPFVMGMLLPVLGYRNLYLASAGFTILIAMIYYFSHGKKVKSNQV